MIADIYGHVKRGWTQIKCIGDREECPGEQVEDDLLMNLVLF